jgi:chromosomal replication initiation ATPase DnaA
LKNRILEKRIDSQERRILRMEKQLRQLLYNNPRLKYRKTKDPIDRIKEVVAKVCHITVTELAQKSRERRISWPKHLGMYFSALYMPEKSFADISFRFGYTNHTIVTHAKRAVKNQLDVKEFEHMREHDECKEILDAYFGKNKEAPLE